MNLFSPTHLIVVLILILLLFGRGKISEFMGDFAKGIKSFKKGLQDDDKEAEDEAPVVKTIEAQAEEPVANPRRKTTASAKKTAARKTTGKS